MASAGGLYQIRPMSRIPMRETNTGTGSNSNGNHIGNLVPMDHLSPLERLRIEYQEKLLLEKEKKISIMYEKRNNAALAKVRKYSGKRNHTDGTHMTNGSVGMKSNGFREMRNPTSYSDMYKKRTTVSPQNAQVRRPQKLPPLNNNKKPSSYHAVVHEEKRFSKSDLRSMQRQDEYHIPDENNRSSPPPNTQHLRLLRERKLRQRKLAQQETKIKDEESLYDGPAFEAKRKLTDFEKWQQQQDDEKFARLQRYHAKQDHRGKDFNGNSFHSTGELVTGSQNSRPTRKRNEPAANPHFSTKFSSNPSKSPEIKNDTSAFKRKEILRQGIGSKTRIAELEQEIVKKQMDLRRMQEQESALRSGSGDNFSASEANSDQDFEFLSSYAPISKPVKVSSKRMLHDYNSNTTDPYGDEAEVAFQNKPVIVRRAGSQESNRGDGTPKIEKNYPAKKPTKKHKPHKNKASVTSRKMVNGGQSDMNVESAQFARYDYTSSYPIDSITEEEQNIALNLVPCNICGRKFAEDRLSMHSKVCAKNQGKKRKVFDMTKARTQGTDAEKFVRRKALKRGPSPPVRTSDWRRKHEDFINTIRSAKLVSDHIAKGGKVSDLPPPPPSENPDYVKCQYCQRRFNPTVAERHIPRCKDIKARPKPPKRK